MRKTFIFFTALGMLIQLASCMQQPVIGENYSVPNTHWAYKQVIDTTFTITNTQTAYDVYFNLRNTNDYAYQNIYILFKLYPDTDKAPANATRLEFPLANDDGTWLGSGSGAIYSTQYPLKTQYKFDKPGKYHIYIEQNMRDNPLNGISDIGFSVEPHQK